MSDLMDDEGPLGEPVDFTTAVLPGRETLRGRYVLLRPVEADGDADPLFASSANDPAIWTYLPDGPYPDVEAMRAGLRQAARTDDPLFFTVVPLATDRPSGVASYLRIAPEHGTIEIGHIWFGPSLQRSAAATEVIYLLAHHAFDELGYRRLEWKCNALNAASRRAAERFGFTFEGIFRQHLVVKGRNRDTAWYAIVDRDWPPIREAFGRWLDPTNFDEAGRQRLRLSELRLH